MTETVVYAASSNMGEKKFQRRNFRRYQKRIYEHVRYFELGVIQNSLDKHDLEIKKSFNSKDSKII